MSTYTFNGELLVPRGRNYRLGKGKNQQWVSIAKVQANPRLFGVVEIPDPDPTPAQKLATRAIAVQDKKNELLGQYADQEEVLLLLAQAVQKGPLALSAQAIAQWLIDMDEKAEEKSADNSPIDSGWPEA